MFKSLYSKKKNDQKNFDRIVKKEMKENKEVLESLRDYDVGKKDISTGELTRRVQDIQTASQK